MLHFVVKFTESLHAPGATPKGTMDSAPGQFPLGRRSALRSIFAAGAGIGTGALIGGCSPTPQASWAFSHGVASGDPTSTSVVIWTRVAPLHSTGVGEHRSVTGSWQVAEDEAFMQILSSGAFATGPERDYTVKIDALDLPPGRRLTYRFRVADQVSPIGHAITLPEGPTDRLRLALFSCSNYGYGYFNAYRHCAERDDIDLAVHVGDYIYEYPVEGIGERRAERDPNAGASSPETVTLDDYRRRYALYRSDPDLQEVHRRLAFVTVWDDHEIANDAWTRTAENHQTGEGSWTARRSAAMRAYFEWMPIRQLSPDSGGRTYRSFAYGNLATIIMLDTRMYGRDQQLHYEQDVSLVETVDDDAGTVPLSHERALHSVALHDQPRAAERDKPAFRKDWDRFRAVLNDPARSILGREQEAWLDEEFRRSHAQGTRWRLLGQQTLMGLLAPPDPAILFPSGALNDAERHFADQYAEIAREDMPLYLDSFGGSYRAARRRLLAAAAANGGNTVILSGDSHNAWAFNLRGSDGEIAAVEIGATSVTSPGFEDELPLPAEAAEHALIAKNPELSYCRLRARGYTVVTISPDAVDVSWIFVDTVKTRNFSAAVGKRLHIPHTSRGGTAALAEA